MARRRNSKYLSRQHFVRHLTNQLYIALLITIAALGLGILGYHYLENLPWIDALLNASMILGGMGPVDQLHTVAGKLFASFYAIFSGVIFIALAGVLFAPLLHRALHRVHLEAGEEESTKN